VIGQVLCELRQANYVNDERYSQLYAEQLIGKGHGPLSVRAKLRDRGIAGSLVDQALNDMGIDWVEHASDVLQRRFDVEVLQNTGQLEQARIARFLAARGFTSGMALRALKKARSVN